MRKYKYNATDSLQSRTMENFAFNFYLTIIYMGREIDIYLNEYFYPPL